MKRYYFVAERGLDFAVIDQEDDKTVTKEDGTEEVVNGGRRAFFLRGVVQADMTVLVVPEPFLNIVGALGQLPPDYVSFTPNEKLKGIIDGAVEKYEEEGMRVPEYTLTQCNIVPGSAMPHEMKKRIFSA